MSKHTKEPWICGGPVALASFTRHPSVVPPVWEIGPATGSVMPQPLAFDAVAVARDEEHARRIVACVNACEGINPEAVPELVDALRRISDGEFATDVQWGDRVAALRDVARSALKKAEVPQ